MVAISQLMATVCTSHPGLEICEAVQIERKLRFGGERGLLNRIDGGRRAACLSDFQDFEPRCCDAADIQRSPRRAV